MRPESRHEAPALFMALPDEDTLREIGNADCASSIGTTKLF